MQARAIRRSLIHATLVAALVIVSAAAVVPWWLGTRIQSTFARAMAATAANAGLHVRSLDYHRGWFSSTARASLALDPVPVTIEATYQIDHGPLVFTWRDLKAEPVAAVIRGSWVLQADAGTHADLASAVARVPPARLKLRVAFDGTATGRLAMNAGTVDFAPNELSWEAFDANIAFAGDGSWLTTAVRLPAIQFARDADTLEADDVQLNTKLHRTATGLLLGDASITTSAIMTPNGTSIANAHAEGGSQMQEGMLAVDLDSGFASADSGDRHFGPASLSLTLKRLDPGALRQYVRTVDDVLRRALPSEQAQMILFGRSLELAGALSRNNPVVEIRQLSVRTPYGEVAGHARFTVLGDDRDITANPMLLVTAVEGDAEASVPKNAFQALIRSRIRRDMDFLMRSGRLSEKEAARLTPETIDTITDAAYPAYMRSSGLLRYFRADGDRYLFRLALRHGTVRINGKSINPLALDR